MLPWVIPERCEGCAGCVSACACGCLSMHETPVKSVFVPWLDDIDGCAGCGACEAACVWGAISMTSYTEDARRRFAEREPGRAPEQVQVA